jgi:hypothetical protein
MDVPTTTAVQSTSATTNQVAGEVGGKGSIFFAETTGKASYQRAAVTGENRTETRAVGGLAQVAREVAGSEFVIFLDDFHYIPAAVQADVARQIKAATERGIRICVATVPHRADNVVRNNPELRGRLAQVDTTFWTPFELQQIATNGFQKLLVEINPEARCASPVKLVALHN